jgi:hypothetical protein
MQRYGEDQIALPRQMPGGKLLLRRLADLQGKRAMLLIAETGVEIRKKACHGLRQ